MDIDALVEEAEAAGIDDVALEDWVYDVASDLVADEEIEDEDEDSEPGESDLLSQELASEVNRSGLRGQIEFLAHHGIGEDELREHLRLD